MAKETFSSLIDLFKTSSSTTIVSTVCDFCGNKLSLFRKKKPCTECRRQFCSQCLQRCPDRVLRCKNCFVLTMRPPLRSALLDLKVKDLQSYLNRHNISTRGCLEKEDLVNVLLHHATTPGSTSSGSSGNPQFRNNSSTNTRGASAANPQSRIPGNSNQQQPSVRSVPVSLSSQSRPTPSTTTVPRTSVDPNQNATAAQHSIQTEQGDSDSSSDTSFEIVQMENAPSVHSSSSSSSISRISSHSNSTSATPGRPGSVGQPAVSVTMEVAASASHTSSDDSASSSGSISVPTHVDEVSIETERVATNPNDPSSEFSGQSPAAPSSSSSNSPNFLRGTMASISSESDFEGFSVKQLKDILHRHRVNYHGCCEKAELVERAKRLYRDYLASRAELEKLDLDSLCKICMDAPVECVMLECGHMATCTDCGRQLSECPICRQFVVRIVRTFKA